MDWVINLMKEALTNKIKKITKIITTLIYLAIRKHINFNSKWWE
jgi:hypothetical protein